MGTLYETGWWRYVRSNQSDRVCRESEGGESVILHSWASNTAFCHINCFDIISRYKICCRCLIEPHMILSCLLRRFDSIRNLLFAAATWYIYG